jgi:hypothetical protein
VVHLLPRFECIRPRLSIFFAVVHFAPSALAYLVYLLAPLDGVVGYADLLADGGGGLGGGGGKLVLGARGGMLGLVGVECAANRLALIRSESYLARCC